MLPLRHKVHPFPAHFGRKFDAILQGKADQWVGIEDDTLFLMDEGRDIWRHRLGVQAAFPSSSLIQRSDVSSDGRFAVISTGPTSQMGAFATYANTETLELLNLEKQAIVHGWQAKGVENVCFQPGSDNILYDSSDGPMGAAYRSFYLFDPYSLQDRIEPLHMSDQSDHSLTEASCNLVQFSPDGRHLAASSGRNATSRVQIWCMGGKDNPMIFSEAFLGNIAALSFSPDGKKLACASAKPQISLIDVPSRKVTATWVPTHIPEVVPQGSQLGVWFSTQGDRLAMLGHGPRGDTLDFYDLTGKEAHPSILLFSSTLGRARNGTCVFNQQNRIDLLGFASSVPMSSFEF
jgi:WD40 repeat protein